MDYIMCHNPNFGFVTNYEIIQIYQVDNKA
jgi:hypothetical protein